jgi:hypothetical protein
MRFRLFVCALALCATPMGAVAQERAYFVTYDHYLEEPGNLEVAFVATSGFPKDGNSTYTAPWLELEYGATGWWTTESYLEGVRSGGDGSGFTGWRWENRFRPFKNEHRINPVFYVEYENVNEASRIQKEIVGSGSLPFEPIAELRREHVHEFEGKLILSSALRGWNLAENFTVEKNLSEEEGFEFGYAIGVSRSLGGVASGEACRFCRENFAVGVEAYGALGSSDEFGLDDTRHYLAPVLAWRVAPRTTLRVSNAFGLTHASDRYLLRFGASYEFSIAGAR